MYIYTPTFSVVRVETHIYIYIHIHYMCSFLHSRRWHIYIYIYILTYINIHTHTHTHIYIYLPSTLVVDIHICIYYISKLEDEHDCFLFHSQNRPMRTPQLQNRLQKRSIIFFSHFLTNFILYPMPISFSACVQLYVPASRHRLLFHSSFRALLSCRHTSVL